MDSDINCHLDNLDDVSLSVNTDISHGFLLDYNNISQSFATESCVPHENTVCCNDTVGRSLPKKSVIQQIVFLLSHTVFIVIFQICLYKVNMIFY